VIVLDTNVLCELAKPDPDGSVFAWVARQRRADLFTTAISEAELAYGLALLPKGRRREALAQAVARLLGEGLGGRVLAFDRIAAAPCPSRGVAASSRGVRISRISDFPEDTTVTEA
jgi:toxin FitB